MKEIRTEKYDAWLVDMMQGVGFQEFKLLERLGDGNKPTAIIGEVGCWWNEYGSGGYEYGGYPLEARGCKPVSRVHPLSLLLLPL